MNNKVKNPKLKNPNVKDKTDPHKINNNPSPTHLLNKIKLTHLPYHPYLTIIRLRLNLWSIPNETLSSYI